MPEELEIRYDHPDASGRVERAIIMATDAALGRILSAGNSRDNVQIIPAHECSDRVMGEITVKGKTVWRINAIEEIGVLHLRAEWLRDDLRPWWKRLMFWSSK